MSLKNVFFQKFIRLNRTYLNSEKWCILYCVPPVTKVRGHVPPPSQPPWLIGCTIAGIQTSSDNLIELLRRNPICSSAHFSSKKERKNEYVTLSLRIASDILNFKKFKQEVMNSNFLYIRQNTCSVEPFIHNPLMGVQVVGGCTETWEVEYPSMGPGRG